MTNEANPVPPNSIPLKPFSRQRLWPVRMREQGRYWRCGAPAFGSLCTAQSANEWEVQHRINQYQTRLLNAQSYVLGGAVNAGQP